MVTEQASEGQSVQWLIGGSAFVALLDVIGRWKTRQPPG
jgi:hypothetical protein